MRLNNYGASLDRQGQKDAAREAYRHAIRLDPTLEISKRNLHENVGSSIKAGTVVAGGGALAALKFGSLGACNGVARVATSSSSSGGSGIALAALLVVAVAAVVWLLRRAWGRQQVRRREEDLERRDPELMRLYRQIDADIAAGRIRKK
jgi:hypothetical protein